MISVSDLLPWAGKLVGLAPPLGFAVPDTTWRLSPQGLEQLVAEEGFEQKAYKDTKGIWTIGVGHTAAMGYVIPVAGMTLSIEKVKDVLAHDVAAFERAVVQAVKAPVNQQMFDALVRWCFNIGVRGMTNSTAIAKLNAGDRKGAADAILMWNKPVEIRARRWREHRDFAVAAGVKFIEEEKAYG